jgi:hypothetical protein
VAHDAFLNLVWHASQMPMDSATTFATRLVFVPFGALTSPQNVHALTSGAIHSA